MGAGGGRAAPLATALGGAATQVGSGEPHAGEEAVGIGQQTCCAASPSK